MRHVSSWLQAVLLPDRWDVCGVICPSVSVWHTFALSQAGNAYFVGGSEPDRDSAAEVLMFCSGDLKHGRRLFLSKRYRDRMTRRIARALWKMDTNRINDAIADYLNTCLRRPGHKRPEPNPASGIVMRTAAAPMAWVLVDFLANGADMESAWNTPYAVACCKFDAHRDISGDVTTLESLDEEERFDEWEAKRGQRTS